MSDFVEFEWQQYVERLESAAEHYAGDDSEKKAQFLREAKSFVAESTAEDYKSLMKRIADGGELILKWRAASPKCDDGRSQTPNPPEADQPYSNSENHLPIPEPQESMADQAEQARSTPE